MAQPIVREALIERAAMDIKNWGQIRFETLAEIGYWNRLRQDQTILHSDIDRFLVQQVS